LKGQQKDNQKKDVCHSTIVLEVLFQKWFPLERAKSQVRKKQAKQLQEDQRRKDNMRERFIKNKRSLNLLHISPKKEKQSKSRTTKRAILMSQFDDDEEQETLQKRQRRQLRGYYNER